MGTLTPKQNEISNFIKQKISEKEAALGVCVLGPPGTGKTTFVKSIIDHYNTSEEIIVTSLSHTGIAAANVRGSTIHSFFRLNYQDEVYLTASVVVDNERINIKDLQDEPKIIKGETVTQTGLDAVNRNNLIIIDEISSCGINLLMTIDKVLKTIFESEEDFGGVHLLCIGDFLQLDPVSDIPLWRINHFPYRWKVFELVESLRNDKTLFDFCNRIRNGDVYAIQEILSKEEEFDKDTLYLFTHRRDALEFNYKCYHEFYGHKGFDHLEEGMRMLFLEKQQHVPNGTLGTLMKFDQNFATIDTPYGPVDIRRCEIGIETETYKPQVTICFGSTIHKLQGLTLSRICIKIRQVFEYGLLNVALTRVSSLDKLKVEDISENGALFTKMMINDYELKMRYVENFKKMLNRSEVPLKPPFFFFSENS